MLLLHNGVIVATNISWGNYLGQQLCMLASYFANNVGLDRPRTEVEKHMDIVSEPKGF